MKYPINRDVNLNALKVDGVEKVELELDGNGTREDPLIIDKKSVENLSYIEIFESDYFVVIRNLNFTGDKYNRTWFSLHYSQNITIENCEFDDLFLHSCSEVSIINCKCQRITFDECHDNKVERTSISIELYLFKSNKNLIKSCKIRKVINPYKFSKENIFDNNEISSKNSTAIKNSSLPILKQGCSYTFFDIVSEAFEGTMELPCTGSGTSLDPYCIEMTKPFFKDVRIYGSRDCLILKGFDLWELDLINSKHITLRDSKFKKIKLDYDFDIKLENSTIKKLTMSRCKDFRFDNCAIKKFIEYNEYGNDYLLAKVTIKEHVKF